MLRLRRQEEAAGVGTGAVAVASQQADRAAEAELAPRQPILGPERVAWLADRARLRFRAAA